jgi:hypothetical protein
MPKIVTKSSHASCQNLSRTVFASPFLLYPLSFRVKYFPGIESLIHKWKAINLPNPTHISRSNPQSGNGFVNYGAKNV